MRLGEEHRLLVLAARAAEITGDAPGIMAILLEGAQRRREKPVPRPHRWRDHVTQVHRVARHAWELEAERVAIGYKTELKEFAAENPGPTFKAALVGNAGLGPWS